jgi:hypothetical protein
MRNRHYKENLVVQLNMRKHINHQSREYPKRLLIFKPILMGYSGGRAFEHKAEAVSIGQVWQVEQSQALRQLL